VLWPAAVVFIMLSATATIISSSSSATWDGRSDATAEGTWEMAEAYAPVLRFSTGERTFPTLVGYFLDRSSLVDLSGEEILERPTPVDLESAGSFLFLDFEADDVVQSYEDDRPGIVPTVYARVDEADGNIILQYWLFYVYNQGRMNSHEGDWEMVQVTLSPDGTRAENVMLSQHHSGSLVPWSELTDVFDGTHPMIMVSLGSHANYEPGTERLVYGDRADGLGEEWGPKDYLLVPIGTGPEGDEPAWLRYEGSWGAPAGPLGGTLGKEGPEGPMFREGAKMWGGSDWC
jgi:hypothetical protein